MAISKLLYIGDCGPRSHGKHLNHAINYIMDREKTGGGQWVAGLNCQPADAYRQMRATKEHFGKADQRQGYHLIISFAEGEVDAGRAFEITGRFAREYLGRDYEAVYAVHGNTGHIHGPLVFNSVSFRTGNKYRYKKGDWAKHIQPITNRLCGEYGLSTIEIGEDRAREAGRHSEWNDFRDGKFVWADMVRRDLDAAIMEADTFATFLSLLAGMGYEVKNGGEKAEAAGKYLAVKPEGLTRFKRCKSLGLGYSEERIRERILCESISKVPAARAGDMPHVAQCRMKRCRRAKLSGLQKRYFARLYRTGQLKKRPYSQAYRYRDDIRKLKRLQEEYLFLSRHRVSGTAGLLAAAGSLADKKEAVRQEKSRAFKERARFRPLFDMAAEMAELKDCERGYLRGEELFAEEHRRFGELERMLSQRGYTEGRLWELKAHYRNEIAAVRQKEKAVQEELSLAKRLLAETLAAENTLVKPLRESRKETAGKDGPPETARNICPRPEMVRAPAPSQDQPETARSICPRPETVREPAPNQDRQESGKGNHRNGRSR